MSIEDRSKVSQTSITISNGLSKNLQGNILTLSGPLGKCIKNFSKVPVTITLNDDVLTIKSYRSRKFDIAIVNTVQSHVKNMIRGVTKGFTYRLKVVYAHFPMTVKIKDDKVYIENFYGERSARIANILGDCKVIVEGDDVVVKGVSIEDVGQTAANIEQITRIKRKDQRVFLDGVYFYDRK